MTPPQGPGRVPSRIEPVPGTPFGLAIFAAPPATSGPSIGALVAGIAAVLVSFLVVCVGLAADAATATGGQAGGWGALVGGAFAVLAGFLGFAGVGLGVVGVRQTRQVAQVPGEPVRGRGMAITGIVCGAVGVTIAGCALGVALLVTLD